MPTLLELQREMARALRSGDAAAVKPAIEPDGLDPAARLGVYRNHFLVSLGDVLAATYPVVARLVGETWFRAAARRFVQSDPPCSPCLAEYGAGFPDFLESLPEAGGLSYLADVARLEWALASAGFAPDAPALVPDVLAAAGEEAVAAIFVPHPSVALIRSAWPIDRIWRANRPGRDPETVDLGDGGVRLLVHRHDGEVGWQALPPAEFRFVSALAARRPLGIAAAEALAEGGAIAFDVFLAFLLEAQVFVSVSIGREEDLP